MLEPILNLVYSECKCFCFKYYCCILRSNKLSNKRWNLLSYVAFSVQPTLTAQNERRAEQRRGHRQAYGFRVLLEESTTASAEPQQQPSPIIMHAVFTHPFKAGEPGLAFSDCIMLLEQLKARRKNEVHTSWRPASIEPLLRSGFSKGTSVCTKFDRAFPLNLAMTSCSARRVAISPLPRTNDSTHLNLLQHIKPSLAISSTSTTLLMPSSSCAK